MTPTNMEHIKKLFIMPDSADKFHEFGNELLDLLHSFFTERGGIHSSIQLSDLEKIFSNTEMPASSQRLSDVLYEIKTKVIAHSVKVGNPYYVGHMTSAIPYFVILLEMIIAALNQNQVKIETAKASTFLEREFIAWMHRLIFQLPNRFYKKNIQRKDIALGNMVVDGTMANLTAVLVARNKAFPETKDFGGIRLEGIHEAYNYYGYDRAVVIVSRRGHYSLDKVGRILGIGGKNIIKIPIDSKNTMDIDILEETCREIEKVNKKGTGPKTKIIAIIGIAGTTETGNVDNLEEIGRIAKKYGAHFHIDAAWGGGVIVVDKHRHYFKGIEKADSVTIDAHKLLYAPPTLGMVFFKDGSDVKHLMHTSNYIIRKDSVDMGRFSVEGSRPFSSLKAWAIIKIIGKNGFELIFEHAFELTSAIKRLVNEHENFEAMNDPELFIFNYRFIPKEVHDKITILRERVAKAKKIKDGSKAALKEAKQLEKMNCTLNDLNIELHKAIREEDESFVSRTMFDIPKYFYQDCVILRAITVNPLTTAEILEEIITQQNKLGTRIFEKHFARKFNKFKI